ncbi:hypothetical protein Dimus_017919, partial [Dionaea muscipula]
LPPPSGAADHHHHQEQQPPAIADHPTSIAIIFCRFFNFFWCLASLPTSATRDWFFTRIGSSSNGGPPSCLRWR